VSAIWNQKPGAKRWFLSVREDRVTAPDISTAMSFSAHAPTLTLAKQVLASVLAESAIVLRDFADQANRAAG